MRRDPRHLAILGARPAFADPRHVGSPNIPDPVRLHERLDEVLCSRRLTNDGPFVRQFEEAVASVTGARHAVAMCNATIAMQVLYKALGLSGEVIMPAFTFVATAHAAMWEGLRPVFADVDPATHTIAPEEVAARITPRTAAIVGVHLWGRCCDADPLQRLANDNAIPLLLDAAQALGATYRGRPLGTLGLASVVSFHATKIANSAEGGMVLTCDDALADRLRRMRNFGFEGYDSVSCLGTNAKLSEVSAIVGLGSIEALPATLEVGRLNRALYYASLSEVPGLSLLNDGDGARSNSHYIVGRIDAAKFGLTRDEIVEALHAENILARRYFTPGCHRMPPHAGAGGQAAQHLPVTEQLAEDVIVLPSGSGTSGRDIKLIATTIGALQGSAAAVRARLQMNRGGSSSTFDPWSQDRDILSFAG